MNHDKLKEMLYALYDGELERPARTEMQAHLASCTECRNQWDMWHETSRIFFTSSPCPISEGFVDKVMDRLAQVEPRPKETSWDPPVRWLVPSLSFACACFLLFLTFTEPQETVSTVELLSIGQDSLLFQLTHTPESIGIDDLLDIETQQSGDTSGNRQISLQTHSAKHTV